MNLDLSLETTPRTAVAAHPEADLMKPCVVSLPKAGSVWVLSLVADCLGLPIVAPRDMRAGTAPCVTKCHRHYEGAVSLGCSHLVYLARDPRDAFISYYNYQKTPFYQEQYPDYAPFPAQGAFYEEYYLPERVIGMRYAEHHLPYLEHGVPCVRYEDLCGHPEKILEGLFAQWEIEPVASAALARAIEKNSFENAKKHGVQLWSHIPATHFRKGKHGTYKEELSPDIAADLCRRFRRYMEAFGYAPDPRGEEAS